MTIVDATTRRALLLSTLLVVLLGASAQVMEGHSSQEVASSRLRHRNLNSGSSLKYFSTIYIQNAGRNKEWISAGRGGQATGVWMRDAIGVADEIEARDAYKFVSTFRALCAPFALNNCVH